MNEVKETTKLQVWKWYLNMFALGLLSAGVGIYLFFNNPWLKIDLHSDSYYWFVEFSQTIFQAQSAYYAESILVPLSAKILGFSSSVKSYKLFCAVITLAILPFVVLLIKSYLLNTANSILFLLIFSYSFSYLHLFLLGFPDPLTIILLIISVFQKKIRWLYLFFTISLLSHYSLGALAIVSMLGLLYFSPISDNFRKVSKLIIISTSLVFGKIILLTWYYLFDYSLTSRMDWVLSRGYEFFLSRYQSNIKTFWLTPGIPFLVIYFGILTYFALLKKIGYVISGLFSIAVAYAALFWTVDGLRIFSVVIAAPYAYLIVSFLYTIENSFKWPNSLRAH